MPAKPNKPTQTTTPRLPDKRPASAQRQASSTLASVVPAALSAALFDPLENGKPILIVLAGSNGAGKSTFYQAYLEAFADLPYVNADLLVKTLSPNDPAVLTYAAAELADQRRREYLAEQRSFIMETVFSDPDGDKLNMLSAAQQRGYTVLLIFIGIPGPELSQARIVQRVQQGGHDVPDDRIFARYPRTLANLKQALAYVDTALLFDNSSAAQPYQPVAAFRQGKCQWQCTQLPHWAKKLCPTK